MKITVRISEPLLKRAKLLAFREHTTLKALVEEGLHRVLADRRKANPFRLRKASFKGNGQPGMTGASWPQIRDMIYEGRRA